ncbi:MAG: GNAT family N-acetyltransferase [Kiritimatiellaeota bacterium]|nr:GNAT family N-acetyltransferase [Kiritimatiellota bacterium]
MKPVIETAKGSDCQELLEMLAGAFRVANPTHPEFGFLYPDIFLPTDEAMAPHRIIREEGRIVACVGHYPITLHLGEVTLKVFGIGQVSCAQQARGRGYMTALLHDACAIMEASGGHVSWLGGRRDRYARFGWEVAGTTLRSVLYPTALPPPLSTLAVTQEPAATADPGTIWPLFATSPRHCDITPESWTLRHKRGAPQTLWLARDERGALKAYAVTQEKSPEVLEHGGDTASALSLFAAILQHQPQLAVHHLHGVLPESGAFWQASEWTTHCLANLRILNFKSLLEAYRPILHERLPERKGVTLAIAGNPETVTLGHRSVETLTLDRLDMVRLLFGPMSPTHALAIPRSLAWLDQVFPLPFDLPLSMHV